MNVNTKKPACMTNPNLETNSCLKLKVICFCTVSWSGLKAPLTLKGNYMFLLTF